MSSSGLNVDDELRESFHGKDENQRLSIFLQKLPTQTLYLKSRDGYHHNWIFWSRNMSLQNNMVHEKIKSLLLKLSTQKKHLLVQFWAPVKKEGQKLLSTLDQPFALSGSSICVDLCRFRLSSLNYKLNLNERKMVSKDKDEDEDKKSHGEALVSVFKDIFPRCCLMLNRCLTLQPRWSHVIMWPIFGPPKHHIVGVLEFVFYDLDELIFQIFKEFKKIVLQEDLSTYDLQERLLSKGNSTDLSTYDLEGLFFYKITEAKNKLDKALKIVCETLGVHLAQAWWAPQTRRIKRVAIRMVTYFSTRGLDDLNYYEKLCEIFPLEEGKGIVWKTLATKKPCFCEDTSVINGIRKPFSSIDLDKKACFAICLNSNDTGAVDWVLEFYCCHNRNKMTLLGQILMTLKRFLPTFKVVSGEKLGDQLCVLDIKHPLEDEHQSFTIICDGMVL